MNYEVLEAVEKAILSGIKGSKYEEACKARGLNAGYIPNQLSAFIGELVSDYVNYPYEAEKLRNAQRMLENLYHQ